MASAADPKTRIEALRAKRKPLFEELEKDPRKIDLCLEIKVIDDQIAEYSQEMVSERSARSRPPLHRSASSLVPLPHALLRKKS
jgi:hypothetical protein